MYNLEKYLTPTDIIDSDNDIVINYMKSVIGIENLTYAEKAVRLYLHVRDSIRYNPYLPFYKPEHYRSSNVIKSGQGFCIGKAGLLCAVARAAGIPSRIGFATVKNHISTRQLLDYLGSEIISYHGYTELWLGDKWIKATPAFNAGLCALHKVPPLEFDGIHDSIFHEFNSENARYMEYIAYHGEFADIPVDLIVKSWEDTYGKERVAGWKDSIENKHKNDAPDFMKEDVI
jgi:transglutaminase-like putative cysteine protease